MRFHLLLSALFATTTLELNIRFTASHNVYKDPAKAAQCKKKGGSYKKQGQLQNYICVKSYKDAFKACTSSDQCLGDCIVTEIDNPKAFCQPDDSPFGCWTTIQKKNDGELVLCTD